MPKTEHELLIGKTAEDVLDFADYLTAQRLARGLCDGHPCNDCNYLGLLQQRIYDQQQEIEQLRSSQCRGSKRG